MSPLAKLGTWALAYVAAFAIFGAAVWFCLFVITHLPKGIAL